MLASDEAMLTLSYISIRELPEQAKRAISVLQVGMILRFFKR